MHDASYTDWHLSNHYRSDDKIFVQNCVCNNLQCGILKSIFDQMFTLLCWVSNFTKGRFDKPVATIFALQNFYS